jgi:hypothetical protein
MSDVLEEQTVILTIICLLVAKFGQTLSVNKRTVQNLYMERFNRKKLNDVEVKLEYQVRKPK